MLSLLFNSWHMHEGCHSHSVCESLCVCYHTSCYMPSLYIETKVLLGFLWHFQEMHCVDFIESTFSKHSLTTSACL